jgi:ubiquinone/menaquinone biosynthesis C-methylase UbiE
MPAHREDRPAAQHDAALEQYRKRAPYYDFELVLFEPIRRVAIERLAARPGSVVLDVGCGTGLSLSMLQETVGPRGRVIGIEQCPEMLERARVRVQKHGWKNVALIEGSVEQVDIKRTADAALFHFTHDILRDTAALSNVARHLAPGAQVVASGLQWASPWAWPLNVFVLGAALHSVTSLNGLTRPWSLLESHLDQLRAESFMAGAVFVVSGLRRG